MQVLTLAVECRSKEECITQLKGFIEILSKREVEEGLNEQGWSITGFGFVNFEYQIKDKPFVNID